MTFDIWESLKGSLLGSLGDFTNEILTALQKISTDIIMSAFFIEETSGLSGTTLNATTVSVALRTLYFTTVGLLALKLCWQGYKVYVLWRDGEAEVSPVSMAKNAIYALGVAMAFPVLYKIAVEICIEVSNSVSSVFPVTIMQGSTAIMDYAVSTLQGQYNSGSYGQSFIMLFLALIYIVVLIILVCQMFIRGAAMLIYRLGVPFAVVGLVNNDGGSWKSYIQIFFQQIAIVMIQNFLIRLSLLLISTVSFANFFFGIILLFSSFKMPKILAPVLQTGGNGGAQVVYTVMLAARAFKGGV